MKVEAVVRAAGVAAAAHADQEVFVVPAATAAALEAPDGLAE